MKTAITTTDLRSVLGQLSARDQEFALSLINAEARYGSLTAKQVPWVGRLYERATKSASVPETVEVGSMASIYAMFDRAGQGRLKAPKIHLQLQETGEIVLYVAKGGQCPGSVQVTSPSPYGDRNKWFGRIHNNGTFEKTRSSQIAVPDALVDLLQRFANDPLAVAADHGSLTGRCCFCNTKLTDQEKSTKLGYGPVCARKWVPEHVHQERLAQIKQAA